MQTRWPNSPPSPGPFTSHSQHAVQSLPAPNRSSPTQDTALPERTYLLVDGRSREVVGVVTEQLPRRLGPSDGGPGSLSYLLDLLDSAVSPQELFRRMEAVSLALERQLYADDFALLSRRLGGGRRAPALWAASGGSGEAERPPEHATRGGKVAQVGCRAVAVEGGAATSRT